MSWHKLLRCKGEEPGALLTFSSISFCRTIDSVISTSHTLASDAEEGTGTLATSSLVM